MIFLKNSEPKFLLVIFSFIIFPPKYYYMLDLMYFVDPFPDRIILPGI